MRQGYSISSAFDQGLKSLGRNLNVILVVYLINLLMAFLLVRPFKIFLNSSIADRPLANKLSEGFDYGIVGDLIRENDNVISVLISSTGGMVLLYVIWVLFYTGGLMAIIKEGSEAKLESFWRGGAKYFFRLLLLLLLLMILTAGFLFVCYKLLMHVGVNPFDLVSEEPVIKRLQLISALTAIFFFLISIFRDLMKVSFINASSSNFMSKLLSAMKNVFSLKHLGIALLHTFILGCIFIIFYFLKKLSANSAIILFLVSQVFLLLRIIYKYVRLSTFYHASEHEVELV